MIIRVGLEFQSSITSCDSGDCMGRSSVQFPTMPNAIHLIFESIGASARYSAAYCLTEIDEQFFVFFLVSKSKQMWFKIIPHSSLVGWWPLWSSLFSFVFCLALFVLWRPNQLDSILRFAFLCTATVDSGNGFALIAAILHGLCEKLLKRSSRKLGRSTIVADCWGVPPFGPSSIVKHGRIPWTLLGQCFEPLVWLAISHIVEAKADGLDHAAMPLLSFPSTSSAATLCSLRETKEELAKPIRLRLPERPGNRNLAYKY